MDKTPLPSSTYSPRPQRSYAERSGGGSGGGGGSSGGGSGGSSQPNYYTSPTGQVVQISSRATEQEKKEIESYGYKPTSQTSSSGGEKTAGQIITEARETSAKTGQDFYEVARNLAQETIEQRGSTPNIQETQKNITELKQALANPAVQKYPESIQAIERAIEKQERIKEVYVKQEILKQAKEKAETMPGYGTFEVSAEVAGYTGTVSFERKQPTAQLTKELTGQTPQYELTEQTKKEVRALQAGREITQTVSSIKPYDFGTDKNRAMISLATPYVTTVNINKKSEAVAYAGGQKIREAPLLAKPGLGVETASQFLLAKSEEETGFNKAVALAGFGATKVIEVGYQFTPTAIATTFRERGLFEGLQAYNPLMIFPAVASGEILTATTPEARIVEGIALIGGLKGGTKYAEVQYRPITSKIKSWWKAEQMERFTKEVEGSFETEKPKLTLKAGEQQARFTYLTETGTEVPFIQENLRAKTFKNIELTETTPGTTKIRPVEEIRKPLKEVAEETPQERISRAKKENVKLITEPALQKGVIAEIETPGKLKRLVEQDNQITKIDILKERVKTQKVKQTFGEQARLIEEAKGKKTSKFTEEFSTSQEVLGDFYKRNFWERTNIPEMFKGKKAKLGGFQVIELTETELGKLLTRKGKVPSRGLGDFTGKSRFRSLGPGLGGATEIGGLYPLYKGKKKTEPGIDKGQIRGPKEGQDKDKTRGPYLGPMRITVTGGEYDLELDTRMGEDFKRPQEKVPARGPEDKQKRDNRIIPIGGSTTISDLDLRQPLKMPEIEKPTEKTPPLMYSLDDLDKKTKEAQGYNVYAKDRGQNVKLNKKPLPRTTALNLGAEVVDNTASASFTVKKAGKTQAQDDFIFMRANKFNKKGERYIERNTYRIDTSGEFNKITVKGWLAQKNKLGRL